ncbi:glycine--tRNA ligase subunit beta [Alkalicoccus urumqiensis]|uniref:Glycine--tRNA ligase beta subunit n=1 Tax=Alkalicoccus urumqiensis TaxID=1548213 RepID=A0A2P6MFN8_ALKUR|nr:glycine--tRNA ligase subunit beta [Alkalicoccus urumqiensis]PRO65112.1 glycine--tRNA ligase subunit beta [Alkalicoccus urumqiensis]
MNKQTLLIEIGLEEMPARFVPNAENEWTSRAAAWLKENRISFDTVRGFSTPRRLAVQVSGVDTVQPDIKEEAKGPAEKIGRKDGQWTKAAEGFARGQGVTTDDLYVKEIKGESYLFAEKHIKGAETAALLPELKDVLLSIPFPKNMRWADRDIRYVRPIKWITALFGEDIIPMEAAGVTSGRTSRGHRFLGGTASLSSAEDYETALKQEFVIADSSERKRAIVKQIEQIAEDEGWQVPMQEGLLDEVNNLVEYPTALFGTFDESFLQVPEEVLITSMREHQRYFPVMDKNNVILPHFVTVRNGDHRHLDNVRRGNEKVLRARLADAEFFYQEDKKQPLEARLPKLSSIVYHEELGTLAEKTARIRTAAAELAQAAGTDERTRAKADRAAALSKADLVTHMVDEFPELEGLMGEYYALHDGEDAETAAAIREHYLPKQSGDEPPHGEAGRLVSAADKLDTLVTSFGIGAVPTGSQDPYGLRRQAQAVLYVYLKAGWSFSLHEVLEKQASRLEKDGLLKRPAAEVLRDLHNFFDLRWKNLLKERGVRYDVADAVMAAGTAYPAEVAARADFFMQKLADPSFKEDVEAFSRVTNIASKAENEAAVDPSLFENEAEKNLYEAMLQAETAAGADTAEMYAQQTALVPLINRYFDETMVMADDPSVRSNRLAQMKQTSAFLTRLADYQAVVFHS